MDLAAISKAVTEVGIEPAIIAALLYLLWAKDKAYTALLNALNANTTALALLTAFVRGSHDS